jgi:putative selenate reductase
VSELVPMTLSQLLRRALAESESCQAIYDLPKSKWYRPKPELDLGVEFHGERAATPLGPAAGPQSQLAQNIVLSWLGGSRIIELKTVQVLDELQISRPCIDAHNVGYNIEWSQELRVQQSLEEYAKAWFLLRILHKAGPTSGLCNDLSDTLFDLSVGYDLAGIRSPKVTDFIAGMGDASKVIDGLRGELRGDLARFRDMEVDPCMSNCVTLSTFHGCPADEIESICNYLLAELGVHVVVKMNPTLLGYDKVCSILHDELGYDEIQPIEEEFRNDLQWDQALGMMNRLSQVAQEHGRTLGAKFTNTLVVKNHRSFFSANEDRMYLSGQPLFPISMSLAYEFRKAMGAHFPISFSAGIDGKNFADAVACGLTPITTCTDLLRPGGYGRLFKYIRNLEKKMAKVEASNIDEYILRTEGATAAGIESRDEASLHNMGRVVERVRSDPRYAQKKNASIPRKIGSSLVVFDCVSCDKCVPVCPNNANFSFRVKPTSSFCEDAFVKDDGSIGRQPSIPFQIEREYQIGNYADFCNDCGNCDVFCPEDGGPYVEKPRFFGSRETFEAHKHHGSFYIERSEDLVRAWALIDGTNYELQLRQQARKARFTDGKLDLVLDSETGVIESAKKTPDVDLPTGHTLSTHPARTILAIVRGVLDGSRPNPVNSFPLSTPKGDAG